MKRLIMTLSLFILCNWAIACPVCEKQQPEILRGVTHGAGPQSQWDYVIVWVGVLVVLLTLFYSVKWLMRPDERSDTHIKHLIIDAD